MSLPLLNLSGTPYEQGVQHGIQLRDQIRHNLALYYERFEREVSLSRLDVTLRAMRYGAELGRLHPAYMEGMLGIADGGGFHLTDIVMLNVRYEILYHQFSSDGSADGCTTFAVEPSIMADRHLYLGQNWDWFPQIACALVRTRDDDGLMTLVFTEAGIFGGKVGLNSAGVGLAINGLNSIGDDWARLALPFHVRCYDILRRHTFADAVAVVTDSPRACSANFLIAQAPDQVVNLEAAADVVNPIACRDGWVAHTNHFLDPAGCGIRVPAAERIFTTQRYQRITDLLRQRRPLTLMDLQAYLSDRLNYPNGIAQHIDYHDPPESWYVTVASIILDLHAGVMYVSDGAPDENPYEAHLLQTWDSAESPPPVV